MDKVLHCDCGFEARAASEDEFIAAVRRHALEAHGMALSHDEALLLVFRAELDEKALSRTLVREAARDPSRDESSDR